MGRLILYTLWPSFLTAIAAEGVFFTLIDPEQLPLPGDLETLPRMAIYTFGFFSFWGLGAASSALSLLLRETQHEDRTPLPEESDEPAVGQR